MLLRHLDFNDDHAVVVTALRKSTKASETNVTVLFQKVQHRIQKGSTEKHRI